MMLALVVPVYGGGANTRRYSYHYDFWWVDIEAVPAFELTRTISSLDSLTGIPVFSLDDVHAGGGMLFLVDTLDSRINVLNKEFEMIISIKLLRDEEGRIALTDDGEQIMLDGPEGVFFHELGNELFIADTGARRIVVLCGDDFHLKRIITEPDNMVGVTEFVPSKIVVDNAGNIYTVVQRSFEGIVQLSPEGQFLRFFGVGRPTVNLWDHFWRMVVATNEQREVMALTLAPSFNNIDIDSDGFVYATTTDANSYFMVYRLNPRGENVLRQSQYLPHLGDLDMGRLMRVSAFTAVAVNDFGVYAALDTLRNRIFIYNFEGYLMTVINHPDNMRGGLREPSGIAWFGDKLVVTDRALRIANVYELTEFGRYAFGAQRDFFLGNWEASATQLRRAVELNSNYMLAYSGIGRFYLMQGEYERAMYYLRLGQDREFYSRAFGHWRNLWIQRNFWWLAVLFAVLVMGLVYSEIRYNRRAA